MDFLAEDIATLQDPIEQRALSAATYVIGTMAAFWFIERLAAFLT